MKLIVNPHKIGIDKSPVNEREIDITKCEFEFASEITSDYVKEAYFTFEGTTYKQIIANNECSIPNEVLVKKGQVEIGVVAFLLKDGEEVKRYNPRPAYFNTWLGSLKDNYENSEPITPTDKEQIESQLVNKQDKLVSSVNIKTINNESLLGEGNIVIAGEGGTSDYEKLENKPSINNIELLGNLSLNKLGIQPKGNYATPSDIPTNLSELTNDVGYITGYTETDPVFSGSPSARITNQDINNWNNKSNFSGNYNDLTNKPVLFSGNYNDLTNKPTIPVVPTNISAFTNDVGYLTNHQDLSNYIQKSQTSGLVKNDGTIDTNTYLTQHQDISGKMDASKVKNVSSTTAGDVYDVRYINSMIGNIESLLGGI